MTVEEIQLMCHRLASRYKSSDYEDLCSEGIVACLDALEKDPHTHPARFYRTASTVMHDYLNLKKLPVSVPVSRAARAISKNGKWDGTQTYSEVGLDWLSNIIKGSHVVLDEGAHHLLDDTEESIISADLSNKLVLVMTGVLDREEFQVISMRYYEEMTLDEVAEHLETNKMYVSRVEVRALSKIRNVLCYNS